MTTPRKASKKYLKELEKQKAGIEKQLLDQPTKSHLATPEQKAAGKATGFYGMIDVPVTDEDRESYQRAIEHLDSEIERVKKELEI